LYIEDSKDMFNKKEGGEKKTKKKKKKNKNIVE